MSKRFIILFSIALLGVNAKAAKAPRVDSTAVYILQRTVETLQNMNSCNFTATLSYDVASDETGMVKHAVVENVSMKRPDKLQIVSHGDKGHKGLWYNGKKMSYYSFDNNRYAEADLSGTLINFIDNANKTYGIEFPAADFFYPTFVDDVIQTGGNLIYLGITEVNGKSCFHIAGKDINSIYQFWIYNDGLFLPAKLSITYITKDMCPQFEGIYDNWKLNPDLVSSMFDFTAPPKAEKVKINAISNKK